MQTSTSPKRARGVEAVKKSVDLAEDVLYNYDLLSIIFTFEKSLVTIKNVINCDYTIVFFKKFG